jgi:hypothetical protein
MKQKGEILIEKEENVGRENVWSLSVTPKLFVDAYSFSLSRVVFVLCC